MPTMSGNSDTTFPPGAQVGDYRIVKHLGEGASGAVYEVIKGTVAKRMALKVLHRTLATNDEDLLRFEREAMIAGAIEHPCVVQVFDVGEFDGHYFMTMELLAGETLLDRLKRDGTLSVRELADLFVPLASALGAVHDQGVVHRDLKPGNIFLVTRRPGVIEPKLLDFGVIKDLSGIVGGDMTRAHSMVGSPSYMSPEQAEQARAIDVRSDQFTLGSIIWECLIGRKLFDGESLYYVLFKITNDDIAPPGSLRADVPPEVDALIMRLLERDPAKRFASVREVGVALLPYCSEHVRAVWREDLASALGLSLDSIAAAPVEERAVGESTAVNAAHDVEMPEASERTTLREVSGEHEHDEDEDAVTSMIPRVTPGMIEAMRNSAPIINMDPPTTPAPRQRASTHAAPPMPMSLGPYAPPVAPAPPLTSLASLSIPPDAPPSPALSHVPYATMPPRSSSPAPAPVRFAGDETFKPAARDAPPPRRGRALWGAVLGSLVLGALLITGALLTSRGPSHSATTSAALQPPAAVRPVTPPAIVDAAVARPVVAQQIVAQPVAAQPAVTEPAAPPEASARDTRRNGAHRPRATRVK